MTRVIMIPRAIGAEHCGSIEFGIEGDGQKMPIRGSGGPHGQFFRSLLKILRKARTKVRDRAAREKESDREGLAFELAQANRLPQFVGEVEIQERMALRRGARLPGTRC